MLLLVSGTNYRLSGAISPSQLEQAHLKIISPKPAGRFRRDAERRLLATQKVYAKASSLPLSASNPSRVATRGLEERISHKAGLRPKRLEHRRVLLLPHAILRLGRQSYPQFNRIGTGITKGYVMQAWKARLKDGWNITLLESDGGWIGHLRNARTRDEKVLGPYPTVQEAKEKAISDASRSGGVAPATLPVEWRNAFHSSSTVRLLEAERQGNRWRFASVISVVMGIAAAIASLLATLPSTHFNTRDSEIDRQLAAVRLQTAENQARMMAFLQSNSSRPDDIKMAQQLTALQDEMRGLNAKVANYEAALGDDPAKKLALPLLRKDMDTLKDEHKADVTALHEEMARTFDIMKWLLGVLGVGSVLSGLANWRLGRIPKGDEKP